ncbi:isocitrate lyase [Mesorhizobium sp. ORM8.1]
MTDFYNLVPSAPEGRFDGIERPYSPEDVKRLRGSVQVRQTLAEMGANRLWKLIHEEDFVNALGAMSGNQAMQQVRAGLKAIYLSGWQVAADANTASAMYPDQSLYPANAAPELVKRINRTLQRADQIETSEGRGLSVDTWFAPIVADAEAGFGGPLNAFEIMKAFIEAGAAGVHYEDQLASEKKCGHLGGKVLIPTAAHIRNLNAARLAADVMGTATLVVARTDAEAAKLLTSDIDERDQPFVDYDAGRTVEGFYNVRNGIEPCIARAVAYAPHADLIWCETSKPDLAQARKFAEGVHKHHPGKLLAYNCSPSFNWKKNLDDATIAKFQRARRHGLQVPVHHARRFPPVELRHVRAGAWLQGSADGGLFELQEAEFAAEANGYTATKHQREVGTGYFDAVSMAITGGQSSTTAMHESTEHAQFRPAAE